MPILTRVSPWWRSPQAGLIALSVVAFLIAFTVAWHLAQPRAAVLPAAAAARQPAAPATADLAATLPGSDLPRTAAPVPAAPTLADFPQ